MDSESVSAVCHRARSRGLDSVAWWTLETEGGGEVSGRQTAEGGVPLCKPCSPPVPLHQSLDGTQRTVFRAQNSARDPEPLANRSKSPEPSAYTRHASWAVLVLAR